MEQGEGRWAVGRPGRHSALGRVAFGPTYIGPCFGPVRRAEVAAQALKDRRAVPALGTIDRASGRAKAVLFRVVPRAANRARPIWNSIGYPFAPTCCLCQSTGACCRACS
jgi:hypothetical protein